MASSSGGESIALDTDAQAQPAAQWRRTQAVEASGQPPVQPERLREQLGRSTNLLQQAKAGENLARQQAYQRVACRSARAHAAKLRNHRWASNSTMTMWLDRSRRSPATA